mgnify:CR=1 FL=1
MKSILRIALCVAAVCLLCTAAFAADGETLYNTEYCFSEADFQPDSYSELSGIFVTQVPQADTAVVRLGNRVIRAGDVLPLEVLGALRLTPATAESCNAVLQYQPICGTQLNEATQLTIRIQSGRNETPTAVAAELESLGVPCAGLMPVGLDTAIIPSIPNNRTEIRRALKIDEHARVFIFVGRLDPYKQPLDLVPLLQAAPDWYAIIIGRGSLGDELTRRLTDAGLLDRCRLIPQLPNEQVHVYYHACDAFVNLNPNEIFGMSLLEAMYAGCPPVARHAPGPDLIIENGISGLLCGTVPELATALDKTTAAMGHAAQSRVNENFLWQNSAELALTLLPKKGKANG